MSPYRDTIALKPISQIANSDLTGLDNLKKAFENQQSNFQVKQTGRIVKMLRDDNHKPRHQHFLIQLDSPYYL
ncbi:DUF3465 domain-containing protein [Methyloglobulus sp.]|uniref:DUF3465 domain-containing protein n=1 Tax=Methyloglobulus sp. TaxID=2518622 RepID=UPI003988BF7E